jgi:hypothetical protein
MEGNHTLLIQALQVQLMRGYQVKKHPLNQWGESTCFPGPTTLHKWGTHTVYTPIHTFGPRVGPLISSHHVSPVTNFATPIFLCACPSPSATLPINRRREGKKEIHTSSNTFLLCVVSPLSFSLGVDESSPPHGVCVCVWWRLGCQSMIHSSFVWSSTSTDVAILRLE